MFTFDQLKEVQRLQDVNIDSMFDASFESMKAGTYIWPKHITTDKERKEFYLSFMNANVVSPKTLAFKRVVDGRDVSFNIGIRNEDNYFLYIHALANTINGSKSWVFDPVITPQQTQFLVNRMFKGMIISSFGNSAALQHQLKKYDTMDNIEVIENYDTWTSKGLLLTKINFLSNKYIKGM